MKVATCLESQVVEVSDLRWSVVLRDEALGGGLRDQIRVRVEN